MILYNTIPRLLSSSRSLVKRLPTRYLNNVALVGVKQATDQIEYVKSVMDVETKDWSTVKTNILNKYGNINQKNIDSVLLKLLVNHKRFNAALSFVDHLKSGGELNLGSVNSILLLYYEIGKDKLSDTDKKFILDSYTNLYSKYKVLDVTTCERLLHALCAIDEWKKALKVLDDIHLSGNPSHSAYSVIIATLFKLNKRADAMKMIEKSIDNKRPILHIAYEEWINYILRKYKGKDTIVKYLEEICVHISTNVETISMKTAQKLRDAYNSVGCSAELTSIRKQNGQCMQCRDSIECLKLSEEEFSLLQQNVKEKLIVGSDLFLKTSPDELKKFLNFIENTAPYDIVIDALNISCIARGYNPDRLQILSNVVDYFKKHNKKILLLGRNHMLKWKNMKQVMSKTCNFFIDNLSQDDPYFITATILSGAHADIVSKDLLRGHRFQLKDPQLRRLFQRWRWQHQWMVFSSRNKGLVIQRPLPVTPCAQKKNSVWHMPYEREDASTSGKVHDGIPDWSSWLCIRPPVS